MISQEDQTALKRTLDTLHENEADVAIVKRNLVSLSALAKLDSDQLLQLLSVPPGTKLYKYCPMGKYTKSNLRSGKVHLSNPDSFDDVFDSVSDADEYFFINFRLMRYLMVLECPFDLNLDNPSLIELLSSYLRKCADTIEGFRRFLEEKGIDKMTSSRLQILYFTVQASQFSKQYSIESALLDEFHEFSQKHQEYRISCFTTNPTNLKMWSLYANYNKGICIEYTVPEDPHLLVLSVIYARVRGDINFLMAMNDVFEPNVFVKSLYESVLRKDICWAEQDEYRLVCAKGEYEGDLCDFYPITGVYIGNKMVRANQKQILRICKDIKADCYYMQRSLSSFELRPVKIL